jgi:hypothetical protein
MSIRSRDSLGESIPARTYAAARRPQSSALTQVAIGRYDQLPWRSPFASYQRIAEGEEVHEVLAGCGYLQEDARGFRNEQSSVNAGILVARDAMGHNATPFRSR